MSWKEAKSGGVRLFLRFYISAGEYPSTFKAAKDEFHTTGDFVPEGLHGAPIEQGNPTGLFHLIAGAGQYAFVGNGLGGGSLINANVFLRPDQATLNLNEWPAEIRSQGSLDNGYRRAEDMLEPETYPEDFPELHKLKILEEQANILGLGHRFRRVPQTTRFKHGPNNTGVQMQASGLTGQDSTGCNDGSKTTTLVTYLSDAWNWGAELFCECEVRYIQKHPEEGYLVYFAWHGCKRGKFKEQFYHNLMWVHAKQFVFLGAGTIGTSEIMLRSKQLGLRMSDRVGKNISGNGDLLSFGYNLDRNVNSLGRESPLPGFPVGPTITGMIDCRDKANAFDRFVIQEGASPGALAHLCQPMMQILPPSRSPPGLTISKRVRRFLSTLGSRVLGPYYAHGSVEKTQIYLVMGHDGNQASLTLKNDKPHLDFLGVGRSEYIEKVNSLLAKITNGMGGDLVDNLYYSALNKGEITVHPIGGMNMSSDGTASRGATTHLGEVLTGDGSSYYDGLIVVDGAAVPTSLGINPLATITALAERSVELVAGKRGIKIDYDTRNGLLDLWGNPQYPIMDDQPSAWEPKGMSNQKKGIEFTEVMKGFIHLGNDIDDFEVAAFKAESDCALARLFLSVRIPDTEKFISSSEHRGIATGTFSSGLPGSPFNILRGDFRLFRTDANVPDQSNMIYEFDMVGANGDTIHFHGQKNLGPSSALSPLETWKATSTLYVTLKAQDGSLIGKGILHIEASDLLDELRSLNPTGSNLLARCQSALMFLSYFLRQVLRAFLAPFIPLEYPGKKTPEDLPKVAADEIITVTADDGVQTKMRRWEPTANEGGEIFDVLMIPGASVDHNIFALPTIKTNAIEYFTAAGYRCWVLTPRFGITPVARVGFSAFDARLDVLAALSAIRNLQSSPSKIYVIAHCVGSLAFSLGLMDGKIPTSWIRGITISQVFLHPIPGLINYLKGGLPVAPTTLFSALAGDWLNFTSSTHDTLFQRSLNQLLRFYPVGSAAEICASAACHRLSLVYGRLWNHANLNVATHAQLHRWFNGVSMTTLAHLVSMSRAETLLSPTGVDLVTESNIERLRDIPIFLFSGKENVVWRAESTLKSYTVLRERFGEGEGRVERMQFEGRGHLDCWMSEGAVEVWEAVRRRVDGVCGVRREEGEGDVGMGLNDGGGDVREGGYVRVSRRGSMNSDASSVTVVLE